VAHPRNCTKTPEAGWQEVENVKFGEPIQSCQCLVQGGDDLRESSLEDLWLIKAGNRGRLHTGKAESIQRCFIGKVASMDCLQRNVERGCNESLR